MEEIQPGIFREGNKLYTPAASGESVYGERFVEKDGDKYREWNPNRSKAGAAVLNGIELELEQDSEILYLGAASGTTVSHFSDILKNGFIYAVEYSETTVRDLVDVAEDRDNIAPILGNARNPEEYSDLVEKCDIVFQDISQSDQAEIFAKNCERYLKDGGKGLLSVKAQSISTSRPPGDIFEEVREKLSEKFEIVDEASLDPYEKDHLFLKLERKS